MVEIVLPRGIRNRNPGNIRKDHAPDYLGVDRQKTAQEPAFLVFTSMVLGVRALGVLLLAYERHDDCHTLFEFISRYAPSIENDTAAYLDAVATHCRIGENDYFPLTPAHVLLLMEAIVRHENGPGEWISPETYASALKLIFPEGPL